MTDIKSWSTSAANNNAASPNGFPEGMAPSGVNDSAREVMAAVRRWYEDAQWIDFSHSPTQTGATTFTVPGDLTAIYAVGRRLKLTDSSVLYGTVTASSYSNPTTTVTVALDSGALTGALAAAALGVLTPSDSSLPTVPVANGGTGATTAAQARTNLGAQPDVVTTRGDFIVGDATPVAARLPIGAAGTQLISDGVDPSWGLHPRAYLAGLGLSNNSGAPATKVDVAPGVAADSTNARMMNSANTLVIDCGATGANGLDSGALASSTWYHAFLIMKADGTVAALASTSAASPAMPGGYTYKRRIGSFKTNGSANIIAFTQNGDEVFWKASVKDYDTANPGTAAVTISLTVPTGIKVEAIINGGVFNGTTTAVSAHFSSLDQNDEAPTPSQTAALSAPGNELGWKSAGQTAWMMSRLRIRTNTSGQIRARIEVSGGADRLGVVTLGWIDRRGRDD